MYTALSHINSETEKSKCRLEVHYYRVQAKEQVLLMNEWKTLAAWNIRKIYIQMFTTRWENLQND